jgi:hypothetical protein
VTFCGWLGEGLETVDACQEFFARVFVEAGKLLGDDLAPRFFINWVDDSPRDVMLRGLLPEVERALRERRG